MAQRLLRRLCLTCRQPMPDPAPSLLAALGLTKRDIEGQTIYRAVGCRECRFEGYKGRVGIFELFSMDGMTREATYQGKSTMAIRDQARLTGGLKSLREDGIRKILAGVTTIEEVLSVAGRVDLAERSEV
jgi:type II secretory ATPase GspE/PulE/Tfp pilus assembly ATPase PilB-like protein